MALPTNSSGGGLPKKPQQGQSLPRRNPSQELPPGNNPAAQGRPNTGEPERKNPGHGLPSIPQSGPRQDAPQPPPQQRRPRGDGKIPQQTQRAVRAPRPQEGGLPQPSAPRSTPQRPQQQQQAAPQQQQRRQRSEPIHNQYDEGQEDPFEELSLDEVLAEDDEFLEEITPPRIAPLKEPQRNLRDIPDEEPVENSVRNNVGEYYREVAEVQDKRDAAVQAELEGRNIDIDSLEEADELVPVHAAYVSEAEKDQKGQPLYVSEDKKKLKAFGGKKKRKIKVDQYDERKNKERSAKIFKYAVLGGLGLIFAWSVFAVPYTTNNTVSPDEVQSLVQDVTGGTGFPVNAGEGFAKDYMQAYLTHTGNDTIDSQALQYYQTGTLGANAAADNVGRSINGNLRQELVYGPTVYGVHEYTPYSAGYTIGALVNSYSTEDEAPEDGNSTRWEFFRVNVYFDPETEQFSIPPESPALIPEYAVTARGDVPRPDELGDGSSDEALAAEVQSVVLGFTRAWAESDTNNTTAIDQYIVSGEDGEHLKNGFGNEYVFANGDAESSITFQAYPNTAENNVKVDMKVRWASTVEGSEGREHSVEYDSTYVMTLIQQSDGRYLVSDFSPKVYVSSEVGKE